VVLTPQELLPDPMTRAHQEPPRPTLAALTERLKKEGFAAEQQAPGSVRVGKYGCAAVLEETRGILRLAVPPGLLLGQSIARLVDRGFQKFWQDGDRKQPALAEQLRSLHLFEQELRAALGLTTLYNEALGTVSSRYVYDRLEGREQGKRHLSFD
jgi:hypothetical protein